MENLLYKWESKVRDYEVDGQGIVNNATYLNYFEQCRNDYARFLGVDFYEYAKAGYHFVVAGVEIEFYRSLHAGDEYYVTAKLVDYDEKRINFVQEIKLKRNDKLVAKSLVRTACKDIKTRKSAMPDMLRELLQTVKIDAA